MPSRLYVITNNNKLAINQMSVNAVMQVNNGFICQAFCYFDLTVLMSMLDIK